MPQRSPAPPSGAAKRSDDFEWPPTTDDLAIYDIGPDPWHALQDVSSDTFAERHGDPSRRQVEQARQEAQRLAGVLTAVAIVTLAAAWVLYGAMTRPAPVARVHHAVAAVEPALPVRPPRLRIVATYPAEPNEVAAGEAIRVPPPASPASPAGPAPEAIGPPPPPAAAPRVPVAAAAGADALADVSPVAAPAAAAVVAAAPASPTPDAGIRTLLQRYETAYDQRDVRTAAALWPSLDRDALARAFAGLDRQDVDFDRCEIDASDGKGSAVCVGTVRYVPSIGRAVEKADRITWTFDLARSGEDWHIDGLTAR